MRFPPAAILFAFAYAIFPPNSAYAVQACLSEEALEHGEIQLRHAEIESVSELCESPENLEQVPKPNQVSKSDKTVKTTVLVMLLRAYAEALGEMR